MLHKDDILVYTQEELQNDSDEELFIKLKEAWSYDANEPLEVYGTLKEITPSSGRSFYVLEDIKHIHRNEKLRFPLNYEPPVQGVFIGRLSKFNIEHVTTGSKAKARVTLSPKDERDKHNNPFDLMALALDLLVAVESVDEEFDFTKSTLNFLHIEEDQYLESYLYKLHFDKAVEKIDQELISKKNELESQLQLKKQEVKKITEDLDVEKESLKGSNENLKTKAAKLESQKTTLLQELSEVKEDVLNSQKALGEAETKYEQFIKYLDSNMAKLNEILKTKSEMLKQLDLIEDYDLDKLLLNLEERDKREGHKFSEVFDSNYTQAVAYIQAYLWQRKIVYKRSVLEDFLALISTNDLIILAGDSGSGKTNLVKSFAKAIGGKSIIVPVKPNWTSAEDLLGYYNPLENKYLSTKFLDALLEAQQNPHIPYLICLDEMNLARVEYYFADFLSLLEERDEQPEIQLFSSSEGEVLASELRNFISLINDTAVKLDNRDINGFIDIMKDEEFNAKLHEVCGFKEGDSLLKYHSYLKRMLNSFLNTPSSIKLPQNVRIIGAINVDETTHYLSPKILDRAHIMKFGSPLLADWSLIENEIEDFDLDMSLSINFTSSELGERLPYPEFDRESELTQDLITLVKDYLDPLGIEFGLRTIRQALGYSEALGKFETEYKIILNNIILHKVLPKLLFDGRKIDNQGKLREDTLRAMSMHLQNELNGLSFYDDADSSIAELLKVINNAEANDWVVNYWSR